MKGVLGHVDITRAYLQSEPIQRTIYVRPPRDLGTVRGTLCRLTKLPYGIIKAGRQSAIVFENWLISETKMRRVSGIDQLFLRPGDDGCIHIVMEKVTDEILMVGSRATLDGFVTRLGQCFRISKALIDEPIRSNGCDIRKNDEGVITMSISEYADGINLLQIYRRSREKEVYRSTEEYFSRYKSFEGSEMWLGAGVLPQTNYVAAYLQQRSTGLRMSHVVEGNRMLKQLKLVPTKIRYRRKEAGKIQEVYTFADASFNIAAVLEYGQTGVIVGTIVQKAGGQLFQVID